MVSGLDKSKLSTEDFKKALHHWKLAKTHYISCMKILQTRFKNKKASKPFWNVFEKIQDIGFRMEESGWANFADKAYDPFDDVGEASKEANVLIAAIGAKNGIR